LLDTNGNGRVHVFFSCIFKYFLILWETTEAYQIEGIILPGNIGLS